jgi:hypothetical protein
MPSTKHLRTYEKFKSAAIEAESHGDLPAALTGWRRARELAPQLFDATIREIELLLKLSNYEAAYIRLVTALQKFSNQPKLIELQSATEDALLGHHEWQARHALQTGDRVGAVYHYEMAARLQTVPRYAWNYLDLAREVSPYFDSLLSNIDEDRKRTRIYIMGCGRSGTFLLSCLMECFYDTYSLADEVPAGRFARLALPEATHVLKRNSQSPLIIDFLSHQIHILYIVRFPLDVFVSSHVDTPYFISTSMWCRHTAALRRLLSVRRPNLKVLRYEDLVRSPDKLQQQIARHYDLKVLRPFSQFHCRSAVSDTIAGYMNGIRPPDTNSIGRWCSNPEHVAYCRKLWPEIRDDALWLCRAFGYDVPAELEPITPEQGSRHPNRLSPAERASLRSVQFKLRSCGSQHLSA